MTYATKTATRARFPAGSNQTLKTYYLQILCLTFSKKKDSVKPPACVVSRWALRKWQCKSKINLLFPGHGNAMSKDATIIDSPISCKSHHEILRVRTCDRVIETQTSA